MVEPQPSGGEAEAGAWPTRPLGKPPEPPPPPPAAAAADNPDPCALLTPPSDEEWLGSEHRRLERYPVQASRPIAVRLLDAGGQPQGRWFLADILDISRGGLCLLVSGPMQLALEQRMQLDVRCHPDFGQLRVQGLVRWCRSSLAFTTLGIAFVAVLQRVPRLEIERRTTRRDPNNEPWAQE